ncbi:hypothetical protein ACEYYA_02415 [Paracoccus sp. p3-h83]|uniref:hypothetical protein n=1 Tax=Paracoccus sp. p3-h83 TaxID=3342805 RepID=UPI0035B97FC3
MAADYLPVIVRNVPAGMIFDGMGRLRHAVRRYVTSGVVRVIAGPVECHVWIDIRRPYFRPSHASRRTLAIPNCPASG